MSEKKALGKTVAEVLSGATGVPLPDVNAIWENVKENHRKLESCSGPHDFVVKAGREVGLSEFTRFIRWTCTKCKGEIGAVEHAWYMRGLAHGRRTTTP